MTLLTGWLAAAGAFFGVLIIAGALLGPGLSFLLAIGAAVAAYKHFEAKYKVEMQALLNPPSEVWPLPLPEAWLCLKDVLSSAHVQSGVSGISNWHITQEDNTRGTIQAQLNFKQALGSPTDPNIVPRVVMMIAQMTPEGDNTRVDLKYEIMSPMGTGLVESVIKTTQASMQNQIKITKGV